jgi:hypothetical protein
MVDVMENESDTTAPEILAIMERLAVLERRLAEAEMKIYRHFSATSGTEEPEGTSKSPPEG